MRAHYTEDSSNLKNNININFVYKPFFPKHDHDYWECFICMSGSYEQVINDEKHQFKHGDAVLIRSSDFHSIQATSDNSWHINIMFKEEYILNLINTISPKLLEKIKDFKTICFQFDEVDLSIVMDYVSLLIQNDEPLLDDQVLVTNLLVIKILNLIISTHNILVLNKPEWLVELIRKINQKENMWWGAKEVIQESMFSQTHLNRIFNEYFGCPITKYLTSVKINFAKNCLLHSYMNIEEISSLLGFSSVSHLNHIFKERTGLSPLQYRKRRE